MPGEVTGSCRRLLDDMTWPNLELTHGYSDLLHIDHWHAHRVHNIRPICCYMGADVFARLVFAGSAL